MILRSYHNHTVFCDGKNTPEEMVQAAIGAGMKALGFSVHGTYLPVLGFCLKPGGWAEYAAAIAACKARYGDQIEIYLGIEEELYGIRTDAPRDYTIGATHFLEKDGQVYFVDHSEKKLLEAIREGFGGNPYRLTACYYEALAKLPEEMQFDFVAHFDLVTKFNEGGRLFDEEDPRYRKPAMETLEYLCSRGCVFEINTGAISRGYRTMPYPARPLLKAIRAFGGSIVLNCDSHNVGTVCSYLPEAMALARECGFRTHRILTPEGWQEVALGE